ncbi:polysaccharide deacetylase family protein [Undibacterium sp. Jales W-56]|uniref:polysaccharide deacetylase family protein n=1 Tax=Undibacterium sp. Jales W-56 TaxID=2897325 RepID=UPI0021D156CC|nr:polysaccharide deacetylase family protein [Undibacterium sp. Jales W-56]MCU6434133.1 polysaccharide deacetylase family protein [Undibacterium sp. Jales W-56]
MTARTKNGLLTSVFIRSIGDSIARLSKQGRVCIITYHRILACADPLLETEPDVTTFYWQMKVLAEHFNVLPLHDAVLAMKEDRLPPRAVCITFDDGYRSTHDLALPILKEFNLPATVFVTTAYLGEGNMWNDRIIEAIRRVPDGALDLQEIGMGMHPLHSLSDRRQLIKKINDGSKYLSSEDRLNVILQLEKLTGDKSSPGLMLTRDMLVNLSQAGIEIGGHTITHPILTKLDDDVARHEIAGCKKVLEDIVGKPLRLFAYPNGKVGKDFDARHLAMAQDAGYVAAFTTALGSASKSDDFYQIPRSRPWDVTPFLFQLRLLRWLAGFGSYGDRDIHRVKKRALLVAFHFPPQSASSGIQRTLSFTRNLPDCGWEPMVLSADPMAYEQKNSSQLNQLPADTIVKRAYALDAKRHLGIAGRYPEIIALPDRWISWLFSAVPVGLYLIRRYRPKVIWSTFPISTAHLIGLCLQRLTGLPWIADFRDPMLQSDYPKSPLQRKIYAWIERQTMYHCTKVMFTTHSALSSYQKRFPEVAQEKFMVIENGYDEDGFAAAEAAAALKPTSNSRGKITLLHSGVLYTEGRDPSAFFAGIAALKARGLLNQHNFEVILRAPGDDAHFQALIQQHELVGIVRVANPVPYREALAEMLEVDGLLLFQGTPFNRQIPAKIYEYFRARKPIFGLLDPAGDTASVLNAAGFQDLAAMNSVEAITEALQSFIGKIYSGQAHVASDAVVSASSRKHRARQLSQLFEEASESISDAVLMMSHHH